jgi:MFS family permease
MSSARIVATVEAEAGAHLDRAARFVGGRAVSDVGDWLTTVAVAVALWNLTGSVSAPAVAILLRVAPRPLGTACGGRLADRLGALRSLVALNLLRAGITALLAAALLAGWIPLALAALAASQAAGAAAAPAGQAAVPHLFPARLIVRVNAAVGVVDAAALVIGPGAASAALALAGPLGTMGPAGLVACDALSFLLLALLLGSLRAPEANDGGTTGRPQRATAGSLAVLRRPFTRQLALAQLGIFATITCLQAVLPAAASQRFGNADAIGWVYAAIGLGNAAGAVTVLAGRARGLSRRWLGILTLAELLPLGVLALAVPGWLMIGLALISGATSAPYEILAAAEMARSIPAERLGRVTGTVWLFGYSGMLAGGLVAVVLAPRLGWSTTVLWVMAAGAGVLVAGWSPARPGVTVLAS